LKTAIATITCYYQELLQSETATATATATQKVPLFTQKKETADTMSPLGQWQDT